MVEDKYPDIGQEIHLAHLIEELGEAVAAAGKTARYGLDSFNPQLPINEQETNYKWLQREMADVIFVWNNYQKVIETENHERVVNSRLYGNVKQLLIASKKQESLSLSNLLMLHENAFYASTPDRILNVLHHMCNNLKVQCFNNTKYYMWVDSK